MSASALIGQAVKLLSQVPASTLGAVVSVIRALVAGDSGQAERLAKNAALAIAAKRAAAERIRLTRGK
jgi:hypothetical protein